MSKNEIKAEKQAVSREAIKYLQDGMVLGIGSGTTVAYFIDYLAKSLESGELKGIRGTPTSFSGRKRMEEKGIPIVNLKERKRFDMAIDGLDSFLQRKNVVIKGGGAALLREKIVDYAADELFLIGDERKLNRDYLVPVEILPSALEVVKRNVAQIGGVLRVREAEKKLGPVISDNGNVIGDIDLPREKIAPKLENKLNLIPGILESGVFTRDSKILIGDEGGEKIKEFKIERSQP